MTAVIGQGSTALWYLTRATGLVALVLLSATVVLGIVSSMGRAGERWPRFFSQAVHRNLSLLCLVFVAMHVVTTVADGYVPIGLLDAVVPFRSPYRPIWVGFGSLAFDLLLAVSVTSALRRRIGPRAWRGVHWLAYACWPIAVLHGLGTGSDPRLPVTQAVGVACVAVVVGATAWRLVDGRGISQRWRVGGAIGGAVVLLATAIFAALGPLRPGWSHRAGTSSAVLAELGGATTSTSPAPLQSANRAAPATAADAPTAAMPSAPFTVPVTGRYTTTDAGSGEITVRLDLHPTTDAPPLVVALTGAPVADGVALRSGQVTFGTAGGPVTALDGSTIDASVTGPVGPMRLAIRVTLDRATGTASGSVSGTPGS